MTDPNAHPSRTTFGRRAPASGRAATGDDRAGPVDVQALREYGRSRPEFAGMWAAPDGTCVVAFTGDLEVHRRALRSTAGGRDVLLVRRPHSLATLEAAAERARDVALASASIFFTRVDEQAGRPLIAVRGELSDEERRHLTDTVGFGARIARVTDVRRRPRRAP